MYNEHAQFYSIPREQKIWKYLDLFKFLDIIHNKSLFMLRVDLFIDKHEGRSHDRDDLKQIWQKDFDFTGEVMPDNFIENVTKYDEIVSEIVRSTSYVSSWHINDYESSVMWDAYSSSNGGILIETTFGNLIDSIVDPRKIYASKVVYGRETMPIGNIGYPLIFKRREFTDEREFRVFILGDPTVFFPINEKLKYFDKEQIATSQKVDINPDVLIDKAYLHPLTPEWVASTIQGVIKSYGVKFVPTVSLLYS